MPLTMPLPRYFSMPSLVVGAVLLSMSARNWRPNSRSWIQRPSAVTHSPALTDGSEPTTATRSRRPLVFTLSTAQPFSSLKKVTRSISPERLSTVVWLVAGGCTVAQSECLSERLQGRLQALLLLRKPTAILHGTPLIGIHCLHSIPDFGRR